MKKFFVAILALVSFSANAQMMGYGGFGAPEREISAGTYGGHNALRGATETFEVEVIQVREVEIKPQASTTRQAAMGAAGAAVGGMLGNAVKHQDTRRIATVLGGVVGGVAGAMLASPSSVVGQEVIFRVLSSNRLVTVVQAGSNLQPGQRAYAMSVGGELRLAPARQTM